MIYSVRLCTVNGSSSYALFLLLFPRVTEVEESLSASNVEHLKEINESKLRLEEMRNELEDYKARARKSLADKEALIQELKSGNQPYQSESLEISQLRYAVSICSGMQLTECKFSFLPGLVVVFGRLLLSLICHVF